jgi:hypothetical protein
MSNEDRDIVLLRGMSDAFARAVDLLSQGVNPRFYLVCVRDVGAPTIKEFDTMQQCLDAIQELQIEQINNPDSPIYINVFEGKQWKLTKTPAPGIVAGDNFVPLKPIKAPVSENGSVKSLLDVIQM